MLGGGGGIALAAGASRLISPRAFLLTIAVAVAPVPLCIAALDRLGLAWSLLWALSAYSAAMITRITIATLKIHAAT